MDNGLNNEAVSIAAGNRQMWLVLICRRSIRYYYHFIVRRLKNASELPNKMHRQDFTQRIQKQTHLHDDDTTMTFGTSVRDTLVVQRNPIKQKGH